MSMLPEEVVNDLVRVAEGVGDELMVDIRCALLKEKIQDELLKRILAVGRAEAIRELVLACLMNAVADASPTNINLVPAARTLEDRGRSAAARRSIIKLFNIHTSS